MRTHAVPRRRARRTAFVVTSAAVAALAAAPAAWATVYKCAGSGGVVMYQESPCPPGTELRNFDEDPPDLSVIPGGVARSAVSMEKPREPKDTRTIQGDPTTGKVIGDASARKFIHRGMTEAEVLAKIGRPDATAGGSRTRQTHWSYLPAEGDPDTVTSITFTAGEVSDVTRKVVKK